MDIDEATRDIAALLGDPPPEAFDDAEPLAATEVPR
jgi:hypothetical protein